MPSVPEDVRAEAFEVYGAMPGPLKGPGKFWNIDPIWGYILLILATNCAFWFSLYFQFDQTFLTPPFTTENVLVPPFR